MPELTLYDDDGHAFAGHLDGVGVTELVWREPSAHTGGQRGGVQLGARAGG
jgi:hypothetical protein